MKTFRLIISFIVVMQIFPAFATQGQTSSSSATAGQKVTSLGVCVKEKFIENAKAAGNKVAALKNYVASHKKVTVASVVALWAIGYLFRDRIYVQTAALDARVAEVPRHIWGISNPITERGYTLQLNSILRELPDTDPLLVAAEQGNSSAVRNILKQYYPKPVETNPNDAIDLNQVRKRLVIARLGGAFYLASLNEDYATMELLAPYGQRIIEGGNAFGSPLQPRVRYKPQSYALYNWLLDHGVNPYSYLLAPETTPAPIQCHPYPNLTPGENDLIKAKMREKVKRDEKGHVLMWDAYRGCESHCYGAGKKCPEAGRDPTWPELMV